MTPERTHRLQTVLAKRQNNLTIVLENVFDPHNISAVMRSCDAVGVQEIFVLNTKMARHKKWGARSSSSAAKWLTIHQYEDLESCVQAVRQKYNHLLTTHLASNSTSLYDLNLTQNVALVFGNEHAGVSQELLQHADGNFIIPQQGMVQSLNISVACAVTLYEAFRQKSAAGHYAATRLTETEQKTLWQKWSANED